VLHSKGEAIEQAARKVEAWLKDMGLWLNPKKTRLSHTLTPVEGNVGFDFLGFTIKQHPVGKTHTGKAGNQWKKSKPLGFKTHIKPSKEAVRSHTRELKQRIRRMQSLTQVELIKNLNPVIRGWSDYYKAVVSSKTFNTCDNNLYRQLARWAERKHPTRGKRWIQRRYWGTVKKNHWVFKTPEGARIREHGMTKIRRFVKVKGRASPYDGNLLYWSKRLKAHPLVKGELGKLLHIQKGKCRRCGLLFRDGDVLEIDHILATAIGGPERIENKCVLHRHCHDEKTAEEIGHIRALKAAGIKF
jgi:RNA-directed DNA polymerase